MTELSGSEVLTEFEKVLIDNLGEVGKFLLEQQLEECNLSREQFTVADVDRLIANIKSEFSRVIGYGVEKLELDLRRTLRGEVYV